MKTITLALPFDELAAVIAEQLARPGSPARPMPVELIAIGLARWAELEITALVSQAPALLIARRTPPAAACSPPSPPPIACRSRRRRSATCAAAARPPAGSPSGSTSGRSPGCCSPSGTRRSAAMCARPRDPGRAAGAPPAATATPNGCGCADCTAHARVLEFRRATIGGAAMQQEAAQ